MQDANREITMRVSRNTIIGNIVLTAFKLFAGFFSNSTAMLSDAIHSLSDVLSTVIVIIGINLSNKKSDKEHPYGHERTECVAAIILAIILFITGISIGLAGIQKIIAGNYEELPIPGALALVAAASSIAIKELMYWYTRSAAKKTESGSLMADAWHHRSDALSSIGSFVGILGSRLGFPVFDAIACVVICLFILKVSIDIFIDSIGKMMDKACDDTVIEEIRTIISTHSSVIRIDQIKTRLFGNKIYVDVEISTNGNATLNEAHAVAQQIHDDIEEKLPKVKHCMIHMNPVNTEL